MIQPIWLETFPNEQVSYAFDNTGLWFRGDANGVSYPVRTTFSIPQDQTTTVVFTFIHSTGCSDQGVCVYNAEIEPMWSWGPDETRIAYQFNCPFTELDGQSTGDSHESDFLVVGNTYTARFIYNPLAGTATGEVYNGEFVSGTPIDSLTISENLPDGDYKVAFCADLDIDDDDDTTELSKSYITYISVNNFTTERVSSRCVPQSCVEKLKCFKKTTLSCNCKEWQLFSVGSAKAYVPAITVCNQNL